MVFKKDIYNYIGISNANQIISFLNKNNIISEDKKYYFALIDYLLYEDGWLNKNDFKIKYLDTLEDFWFYKDNVYKTFDMIQCENVKWGFIFKNKKKY